MFKGCDILKLQYPYLSPKITASSGECLNYCEIQFDLKPTL